MRLAIILACFVGVALAQWRPMTMRHDKFMGSRNGMRMGARQDESAEDPSSADSRNATRGTEDRPDDKPEALEKPQQNQQSGGGDGGDDNTDGGDDRDQTDSRKGGRKTGGQGDDGEDRDQSNDSRQSGRQSGGSNGGRDTKPRMPKAGKQAFDQSGSNEEVEITVVVFEVGKWPDYRQTVRQNPELMSCIRDRTQGQQPPQSDDEEDERIHALLPCLANTTSLRPFVVLGHYLEAHGDKESQQSIDALCQGDDDKLADGLELVLDVFATSASPRNDFCEVWQHAIVPAYCALLTECSSTLADQTLTTAYSLQQLAHNHSEPFSCKGSDGEELIKTTIEPQVYTADFNFTPGAKLISNPPQCPKRAKPAARPRSSSPAPSRAQRAMARADVSSMQSKHSRMISRIASRTI